MQSKNSCRRGGIDLNELTFRGPRRSKMERYLRGMGSEWGVVDLDSDSCVLFYVSISAIFVGSPSRIFRKIAVLSTVLNTTIVDKS